MTHYNKRLLVSQHGMNICLDCGSIGSLHGHFRRITIAIIFIVEIFPGFKREEDRLCEPRYETVEGVANYSE